MMQLTESQQRFLEITAQSAQKAGMLAREAEKANLMTLAREWDYFASSFEKAIERQLRVFAEGPAPAVQSSVPAPAVQSVLEGFRV